MKGYEFSRSTGVFDDYVKHIYNIKSNTVNDTQKSVAKSLLNNLLGRFGIRFNKSVTKIVSNDTYNRIRLKYVIVDDKDIAEDKTLVTYIPQLDPELRLEANLDIIKLASGHKDEETQSVDVTSIPISAAVTAYGRIHISRIKLDVLSRGGNIYYSDTDSLVTDVRLDDKEVDSKEIGKMKLEHEVRSGAFIAGKTYCLILKKQELVDGKLQDIVLRKAKGVKAKSLEYKHYLALLDGEEFVNGVKTQSNKVLLQLMLSHGLFIPCIHISQYGSDYFIIFICFLY